MIGVIIVVVIVCEGVLCIVNDVNCRGWDCGDECGDGRGWVVDGGGS